MESSIPKDWLDPVLAILGQGEFGREIQLTTTVRNRWDADTLGQAFIYDVREPLMLALSVAGVTGKLITDQPEPGVTYAFWFYYDNRKFYGKICFFNNKVRLKLLSAHRPNKGEDYL